MTAAPPTWTINPSDTQLEANSKLDLICDANGYPKPNLKWFKLEAGKSEYDKSRDLIFIKTNLYM